MSSKSKEDKSSENDINKILSEHTNDATHIIANSETTERAINLGLKLESKRITDDDYINELFESRKKEAAKIIEKLPPLPEIGIPPIGSLYNEIRECVLLGLNGAAITLSSILIEFALKHAIIDRTKGAATYDKEEWDRLENMELGKVLEEISQLKFFDESSLKQLIKFKNDIRNPYLHYNIKKLTKGAIMPEATRFDISTGEVIVEKNLKAEDNPILWEMVKRKRDKQDVITIFLFADSLVKSLFQKSK